MSRTFAHTSIVFFALALNTVAAPPDRITRPLDSTRTRRVGLVPRAAQPQLDIGPVDPAMRLDHMLLGIRLSPSQQAELDMLLAEQQNPASPLFHHWLMPEEFGERFGLSPADLSKLAAWLRSQGFTVNETARARNWIAFSGTAGQVSQAFRTAIHRFQVNGRIHFSNIREPAVPEALADVVGGFSGLDDFTLKSFARRVLPEFTTGPSHFLAPEDFATIYNLAPLYKSGLDGTGQGIAIVGDSSIVLSDLRAFRTRYNLPQNDPKLIPYAGTEPGLNDDQIEANLDLEWAGAIAPKATLYYVYGTNVLTAIIAAINMNLAPIISISYGGCEIDFRLSFYRSYAQQANAQGITILNSSGDSGAAGCDSQGDEPFATRGRMAAFPAVLPEVTGVGGTQFVEGSGRYWASTNSANFGSALSYIPEAAWNESGPSGLISTGGGSSLFIAKPAWQTGLGVPDDHVRDVPDVALSAALHDAYLITYQGGNAAVGGTSASSPSFAGILALLNQYQIGNGFQAQPGLGNINPQLYRLAQSAPSVFHDITSGDNTVPCAQASPDCLTGTYGYTAGPGYDLATGLGSVDANAFVSQWNTQTSGVTMTVSAPSPVSLNDTVTATATVTSAKGNATPTGAVSFSINGLPLGSAMLVAGPTGQYTADLSFPVYQLGPGTFTLSAAYSGDAAFSGGGATTQIRITTPAKVAAIVPSGPNTVWPLIPDAQGPTWQTNLSLREVAGVPAHINGFAIDGAPQPLSQYFPSPDIPAGGTVGTTVVFRKLATPVTRTFTFSGVDAAGQSWNRQISVNYMPLPPIEDFILTATPAAVAQNPQADPSCQWQVQIQLDELGGYQSQITTLTAGSVDLSTQIPAIFGTTRLEAWGSLQGTLCFSGIKPPASNRIFVGLSSGIFEEAYVTFAGPPAAATQISATPASITLATLDTKQTAQATLSINVTDKSQPWTASISPANRTSVWLSASQLSGTGPAQITLTAFGDGLEPGVYRAAVVIQSPNALPQSITIPVMFVLGGSASGTTITGISNPAGDQKQVTASPGMLLNISGKSLANDTQSASGSPLPYSLKGVSATINGLAAPILSVSPNQIEVQVPYAVGAGPAVLGINNNGQIAGFALQVALSSPVIFSDDSGNLVPSATVQQGATASLFVNGIGEVSPAFPTGFSPSRSTSVANQPKPVLPLSVTVGGQSAFIQYAGIAPGLIGEAQINFTVPATVPPGPQQVIVTVGGISSPPVNVTVQSAVVTSSIDDAALERGSK